MQLLHGASSLPLDVSGRAHKGATLYGLPSCISHQIPVQRFRLYREAKCMESQPADAPFIVVYIYVDLTRFSLPKNEISAYLAFLIPNQQFDYNGYNGTKNDRGG